MNTRWPAQFPPFLWGVATSSHQIEGHTLNDWSVWEQAGNTPEPSGAACDHWRRWRDDFELFRRLEINSYRFSLEWSRIQPEPGAIDETALEQYRAMLATLHASRIVPVVTLHHFTLPIWVSRLGGFASPKIVDLYAEYVSLVMRRLGDLIPLVVTINEPMVLTVMGYIMGLWPPGHKRFREAFGVMRHLAESHRAAYHVIKAARPGIQVGISHHQMAFHPWNPSNPMDRAVARLMAQLMNQRFIELIGDAQDFLGINYYTRQYGRAWRGLHPVSARPGRQLTDMGWEIYPVGLAEIIRPLVRYGRPVVITENGIATSHDPLRQQYLCDHLAMVARLQREGVDLRGYFYWSALDNFEWAEGFRPRFGLIAVDYPTQTRTPRPSAETFRHIIRANRTQYPIALPEPPGLNPSPTPQNGGTGQRGSW